MNDHQELPPTTTENPLGRYARCFPRRRYLPPATTPLQDLSAEIEMLRQIIVDQLRHPVPDLLSDGGVRVHLDFRRLHLNLQTLFRAIKTHCALANSKGEAEEALESVLQELMDELEPGTVHLKHPAPLTNNPSLLAPIASDS